MKMKTKWRIKSAGTAGACAAAVMMCASGAGLAAEATASSKSVLPEMVVTAQKRAQKLEEVPISVTAFDEEALALREFNQLEDLAYAAPNVNIASSTDARTTQFTMRGITGQTLFPGAESSVGIFVDGVYVNNPIAQNFDVLNVERVEILRGPQGTLYGKNTTAGAINVISRKPGEEFSGSGSVQYGNYNDIRVKGSVEGPIVEGKLFGQVAATFHKRDGYATNTFLGTDIDTDDTKAIRAALRFTPTTQLEINLSGDLLHQDRVPSVPDTTPEDRRDELDVAMSEKRDVQGVNLTADYTLANANKITSITAYRNYDWERVGDDDGLPQPAFISPVTESTWQISEELRLSSPAGQRLEWVTGLYFLHTDMDGSSDPIIDPDLVFLLNYGVSCTLFYAPAFCAPGVGQNRISQQTDTFAAFGQATFAFDEQWSLTGGLRGSYEKKEFRNTQSSTQLPLFMAVIDASFDRSVSSVSPMVALEYKPKPGINLFASASQGFKSGGFNTGPVASPAQLVNTIYDDESLWSYEAGVKSEWFNKRLRVNLSAFFVDYKDLQAFKYDEVAPGVFSSRITNAATATSKGVELEITTVPVSGLTLGGGLGYIDARYDEFAGCGVAPGIPPTAINCSGNKLTGAPSMTGNLNATYYVPVPGVKDLDFMLYGDWSYRGKSYFDVQNTPTNVQAGYSILNLSTGLLDANGNWSLVAFGQNLTDKNYTVLSLPGFAGTQIRSLGNPRTFGLRMTANF